jgi:hypothetical protein
VAKQHLELDLLTKLNENYSLIVCLSSAFVKLIAIEIKNSMLNQFSEEKKNSIRHFALTHLPRA